MNPAPRNLPRFLPTLTEVVAPSAISQEQAPATPDLEAIVEIVRQRVSLAIEQRFAQEAEAMLHLLLAEQLPLLRARLQQDLESVVWQAMTEVMKSRD